MRTPFAIVGFASVLAASAWTGRALAQDINVGYYTPQFYQDHLVFYDQDGGPIFYENDVAYAVPSDSPDYNALAIHFQDNEEAYARWYQEVGYANLNYRLAVAYGGYEPVYYNSYLVFYDAAGQPIYYDGGAAYPIPPSYPAYATLISHYRRHRAAYLTWYQARGRHFLWYRNAPARVRVVAPHAPRAVRGRAVIRTFTVRPRSERVHLGVRPGRIQPRPMVQPGQVAGPQPAAQQVDCRREPRHPLCRRGRSPHGVPRQGHGHGPHRGRR